MLGDAFPNDFKEEQIKRNIKPGQLIYLLCEFTNPHKDKYLVVLCDTDPPLLFVVNSEIRTFVRERPHLLACQVKLSPSDYDLDHDSYLNCSEVKTDISKAEIISQIMGDSSRIIGELNSNTIREIIHAVEAARTVHVNHKTQIIAALSGTLD